MLRSLRALVLFWSVFVTYGAVWLLGRLLPRTTYERLLGWTHRTCARRLANGFTRLRGVFIKMGQVLSVVGTFLPRGYAEELEKLQDQVPPRPFHEVEGRLREALGERPLERFQSFEREALAAASLAQVHRAVTRDGREVAVKILYPGVEELIRRDLGVLRSILPVVRRLLTFRRFERVLDQLSGMLARETDYAHERQNLERMRELFRERPDVVVPEVVDELTGAGVLVMSFERGVRIADLDGLRASGVDPESVGRLLVECFMKMLFEHRVFHADPHPGNFLVRPGPTLVILDYGAVEEVTPALADGMQQVVVGAISRDDMAILRGLERMGFVAADGDKDLLARVGREYLAVLAKVRIDDFSSIDREAVEKLSGFQQVRGRLREIMRSIEYPEGFFYVERTLVLLFGLVGRLAPKKGLPGLVLPFASLAFARSLAAQGNANAGGPGPGSGSEEAASRAASEGTRRAEGIVSTGGDAVVVGDVAE